MSYKHVFQIWARQVYLTQGKSLSQADIEKVFPEYKDRLQLYAKCCDETGKIVKNFEYFKEYQSRPHKAGKRGGNTIAQQRRQAKKAKDNAI